MDLITNLPQSIRDHIISFLPMEDATRTSVLSRSWKDVCSSLPNLNFDQLSFERKRGKKVTFKDLVQQILDLHDASNVQKFRLVVEVSCVSYVNSWISFALQRNVRELEVSLPFGRYEILPCSLFTCRTLTNLCLRSVVLSSVPTTFALPMLKIMEFEHVEFSNDAQTEQLISSCSLLEDLVFNGCFWVNSDILVISAPSLKKLKLSPSDVTHQVKIRCNNLCHIDYLGNPPDISPETLSSLLRVDLEYFPSHMMGDVRGLSVLGLTTSKILRGLRNVVSLFLECYCIEFLARDEDLLSHLPTSCCSLKDLNLYMCATKIQIQVATFLLRSYTNLQTLSIFYHDMDSDEYWQLNKEPYWQSEDFSTEGTLEKLTSVDIDWCGKSYNELDLVIYLLVNSNSLEKMTIRLNEEEYSYTDVTKMLLVNTEGFPYVQYI